ncbi:MAG: UDP-glucose dehydrogenase family protein [Planctomycetota bacterium]|jgi:UDPglucose 6-dehydrogenase
MKISIIGTGHVGLVTGACLAERGHRVLCIDSDAKKIRTLKAGKMTIYEPGLDKLVRKNVRAKRLRFGGTIRDAVQYGKVVFMCVPTPPREDGTADLSFVESVSREIASVLGEYRLVAEKSTVPVHTGDQVKQVITKYARKGADFDVASNPEFLREGSAVHDTLHPDRVVIGVESRRAEMIMREVYAGFKAPVVVTDIQSAELIKHASNSFLAMKISYANALARICELSGASVADVTRGMGMDKRISPSFLRAGIGYGGSCFPKDVAAFEAISRELGYDLGLLREVQRINREARELFVKKVEQELWIIKEKKIGALGISFKPDTDDLRDSPAISVIEDLRDRGAEMRAYDPKANAEARRTLRGVKVCRSAYEAARGADCLLVLTDWKEFAGLDYKKIRKIMAHPTVLDGRNLLDPVKMARLGFTYRSVGRP